MKKRLLSFSLIAASIMYCGTNANAQTLLYSNDFESGLNGSTIIGNGVIKDSENPAYGQVFHNAAGGQATRTNYLRLPENLFEDLKTSGTNALTISFWVNKGTASNFYWSPIFSAYGAAPNPNNDRPMMVLQTRGVGQVNAPSGTWTDLTDVQNVKGVNAVSTAWIDNANWHFYTATFTPTNVKVYIDGVVMNEWTLTRDANGSSVDGLFSEGSALNYICLGGNQAWNWNDPDPAFMYDKLKIYAGALTTAQINALIESGSLVSPVLTASKPSVYLDDKYTTETLVVNGANLGQDISITAPAGITVNPTTISKTAATDVNVTVSFDGSTIINGNITLTSGTKVVTLPVKTSTNAGCFTPLYPTGNLISDPTFSAASLALGGYNGWGQSAITNTRAYCGKGSAFIRGTCWPDGGSIDMFLNTAKGNALVPNSTYRLRAMVNSQAPAGKNFQFEIEGVDGGGKIFIMLPNTNGWKQIDTTFTTGASIEEKGIYFNSCTSATPAFTDTCFIDNWELYRITGLTSLHNTTEYKSHTYIRDNKVVTNFNLPVSTEVSIALYNVNGMLIESRKSIFNEGNNEITLQAKLTSGVYIVRTLIDGKQRSQKIVF